MRQIEASQLFKLSGDAAERSIQLGANVVDHSNEGKRDPRCNQPVLNGCRGGLVSPKVCDFLKHSGKIAFYPSTAG
jgi:hypothetical protein